MARYVISDLHYGHENIIDYCNRPFDDVDEMNETLVNNWNSTVGDDDVVIFLGDLAMWGHDAAVSCFNKLNGQIVFVEGNHDDVDEDSAPFPIVKSCEISHGKYHFYCEHNPENVDVTKYDWLIHGHTHNNNIRKFPFINIDNNRINVSAELLGYTPISLDDLCTLLDDGKTHQFHSNVGENNE